MSQLGQKATSARQCCMSVLPPGADLVRLHAQVRSVPCVDGSGLAMDFLSRTQAWVSVAVCSACRCGSYDRWPSCPPRIRSRSKARIRQCDGTSGLS
jgi:hypothetical protein